ncbi:MAG TPA: hypothetical protein VN372_10770 [Methanospirillum sp.]|nr:hypothetical protein [Methanospirillum sp.]
MSVRFFLLIIVLLLLLTGTVSNAEHPSYVPGNESFRPVYSNNLTGYVTPDSPLLLHTEIRDSDTGFVKIYVWGSHETNESETNFDLWTSPGLMCAPQTAIFNSSTGEYPEVITIVNKSSEYLIAEPGDYSTLVTSASGSGQADIRIQYVYHDAIDMGLIGDNDYSVWPITIPSGLSRAIFITESVAGTDLDLFIQDGTTLPSSFETFDYASTSNCTDCWETGMDNYVSEMFSIENPVPGQYLMVTYAKGGNDFFMSYWMGVESTGKIASPDTSGQHNGKSQISDISEKYRNLPFILDYHPRSEGENASPFEERNRVYLPNQGV